MPTYEYKCMACGHTFEQQQAMSAEPLRKCPECRGEIRRMISGGSGFILKGGSARTGARQHACSLETEGRTCCGREERCGSPSCGDDDI